MKDVYSPGQLADNKCGDTVWKAARAQNTTKAKQDETGLAVAGCRHTLAQKAVNMFRGEMYGYPHFLHTSFMLQEGVQFMWQDVICKYWPWAKKQQQKPEYARGTTAMKPALSVMHAKAHAWDCQVKWGGRYQEDAGMGTGEEMEQLFSYLSRLNSTTKNMSAANRVDTITEHVFFWNTRKILTMSAQLCKRYIDVSVDIDNDNKCGKGMDKAEQQWGEFWAANGNRYSRTDIENWHADIVNIAKGNSDLSDETDTGSAAEFFFVAQRLKESKSLGTYTTSSSDRLSLLTGTTLLFSEARKHTSDKQMLLQRKEDMLKILQESDPFLSEEAIFEEGQRQAADKKQRALQQEIEVTCYGIEKRKVARSKEAVGSKQRRKLLQKNVVDKKRIRALLIAYEEVTQLSSHPEFSCTSEQIEERNFPWNADPNMRDAPAELKKKAVDLHMLRKRLAEENGLVKKDMYNYLRFYMDIADNLEYDIGMLLQPCMTGELEVKKKGLAFVKGAIDKGSSMFKKALAHDWDNDEDFNQDLHMLLETLHKGQEGDIDGEDEEDDDSEDNESEDDDIENDDI
ncbi:uncharacterized protein [Amphiura filiformis]|uniref:uncharacterized protein n=1 Tax=Amphiura filiformis TaxID=82378 RepID=UPI003B216988